MLLNGNQDDDEDFHAELLKPSILTSTKTKSSDDLHFELRELADEMRDTMKLFLQKAVSIIQKGN
jgi:hypothetical protein